MEEITKTSKLNQFKAKLEEKAKAAGEWIKENKEIVVVAIPIIVKGVSGVQRRQKLNKEEELKDLYCYDRSLGHYWRLRRKLSNKEWLEINRRKDNGEALGDILAELKVLK